MANGESADFPGANIPGTEPLRALWDMQGEAMREMLSAGQNSNDPLGGDPTALLAGVPQAGEIADWAKAHPWH